MSKLKSFEKWQASLSNFDWLTGVVPGATDADCLIHCSTPHGDSFLMFEFKNYGEPVPMGQKIAFRALSKATPDMQVVVVHGPDNDGLYLLSGDWTGKVTKDELANRVRDWWKLKKANK